MLIILSHTFFQLCANMVIVCAYESYEQNTKELPFRDKELPNLPQNSDWISLHNFVALKLSPDFLKNHYLSWKYTLGSSYLHM